MAAVFATTTTTSTQNSTTTNAAAPVEAPPHFVSPDGVLSIWLVEPLWLISLHRGGPMTVEQARFLSLGDGDRLLEKLARERGVKPWFAHHWAECDGYDVDARPVLMDGGKKWGKLGARGTWIVLGPKTPTLVRMACSIGAVVGSLMTAGDSFADASVTEVAELVREAVHDLLQPGEAGRPRRRAPRRAAS